MADAQKDSEQHNSSGLKDDSAQQKVAAIVTPCSLQPDSQSPTPPSSIPPSSVKETTSTMYQQRQKCELRRLLKHTNPEMKGLGHMVEEEFADILTSGTAPDTIYQGEVHSRCMIFENGAYSTGGTHHKQTHLMEGSFQGGTTLESPLAWSQNKGSMPHSLSGSGETNKQQTCDPHLDVSSQKERESLTQEENFRVDVKATRKMFEDQLLDTLRDNMEEVFPGRIVVSEEEKGAVQKQKGDFETYQNDTVNRNSPINCVDLENITDQESGEVYLGISKAKEIFEKGSHDKVYSSSTSENLSTEDETLKTHVKNRAQMFESMPLDRINLQNEAESATTDEGISKSLASLNNFNVIHSHGTLVEATEAAYVKKVNYNFIQDKGPEIEHEEMVMGTIKSILLQILAKVNLNSLIAFLKEDDQGNVEVKNVEVPTHHLPFKVHQDRQYRTTNMVQVIEDLLGQETCPGKGVLIQKNGLGSVDTLVYTLYRKESFVSIGIDQQIENRMDSKEIKFLLSRNDIIPSPPPSIHDVSSMLIRPEDNRTSNVKLDYLKSLQKSSRYGEKDEELNVPFVEGAMFTTNAVNDGSSVQPGTTVQQPLEDDMSANQSDGLPSHTKNEKCITECENVTSGNDAQHMCNENPEKGVIVQAGLKNIVDDEFLNLQAAIVSLQQATEEAKALQQSIQEKQEDISPSKLTQEVIVVASENQEILDAKKKGYTKEAECPDTEQQLKHREEAIKGSVQTALDSLGKSSFNVTKGDFKAAMIYRNSGKSYTGRKKETEVEMGVKQPGGVVPPLKENKECVLTPLPGQVIVEAQQGRAGPGQGRLPNKPTVRSPLTKQTHPETDLHSSKKPLGPKPAVPPKPDHLMVITSSTLVAIPGCVTNSSGLNKTQAELNSADTAKLLGAELKCLKPAQKNSPVEASRYNADGEQSETGCMFPNERETDKQLSQGPITADSPEVNDEDRKGTSQRNVPENMQNPKESPTGYQASLQNFGIQTSEATAPVKPKRIKMATSSTAHNPDPLQIHTNDINPKSDEREREGQSELSVKMRKNTVRGESDVERRQRLSVHMDDIMRGNTSAALEIFDKLRKQEELQNILSKVEEMEGSANQGHVSDLRKIFDSVPDWAGSQEHTDSRNVLEKKKEGRLKMVCDSEMMSSMEVAFGDLEKASTAIINLKEQTLSRLMDIEETIKKALYSVSTLKSDSDIAGLSGLFKESMRAGCGSPVSGNIRKISIGSSKSSKTKSLNNPEVLRKTAAEELAVHEEKLKPQLSVPAPKPRAGSPSSPSFISIQSAARKNTESQGLQKPTTSVQNSSPKVETFQSTTCFNMSAEPRLCNIMKKAPCIPPNDKRLISTFEVQTKGEAVIGTKTIREKYEETDHLGNTFYSSKTSTVVTTQPETQTCFRRGVTSSSATSDMKTYPRINTPTFKRDQAFL